MKFSEGDPVILKATQQEGKIVEILDNGMFLVNADGVLFPSYAEDLEHPYLQWFLSDQLKGLKAQENTSQQLAEQINLQKEHFKQFSSLSQGLHLGVHPQFVADFFEETLASFDIYLINKSNFNFKVQVLTEDPISINSYSNDLVFLFHCNLNDFNQQQLPKFQLKWKAKNQIGKLQDYEYLLTPKLSIKKFFGFLPKLRADRALHFTQALSLNFEELMKLEDEEEHHKNIKQRIIEESKEKRMSLSTFFEADPEIDLHMQAIGHLYNASEHPSILSFQVNYAFERLTSLHALGIIEAWLIHGVGDGILKSEIHQMLKDAQEIIQNFEHGYFEKYGFGATKVIFK